MTKTEYIEETVIDFAVNHSENEPVYVEDEITKFIAMIQHINGKRRLLIIRLLPPFNNVFLDAVPKNEAIVYCDAITTKVFHRIPPTINDPRVDRLESFFEEYDTFCDRSKEEIVAYLSTCAEKSIRLPALGDNCYRMHSLSDRYCSVKEVYINDASTLAIVVSTTDDTTREATFDDITSNPTLLHDFMSEFYRVTE